MTMYMHKKFNGIEKLSIPIKLTIVSVTVSFIINYLLDIALYVYPYIELLIDDYLLDKETFFLVQQSFMLYNALARFIRGCTMAVIVSNLLKQS